MIGLVYVSSAVRSFSQNELATLLETSRRNNAERCVTGMLLHVGGNFMQALEGDAAAVEETYRKIAKDPRHRTLTVLVSGPIERRLFADWAMGFREADSLPADTQAQISSFLDDARDGGDPLTQQPAEFLLRTFAVTMR